MSQTEEIECQSYIYTIEKEERDIWGQAARDSLDRYVQHLAARLGFVVDRRVVQVYKENGDLEVHYTLIPKEKVMSIHVKQAQMGIVYLS